MSFFHLEDIDQHRHHPYFQIRNDEHRYMDSGGSTVIRSYDCVFCQRGFTTAQALGGHMNIHRKDRANPASTYTPTNKPNTNNKEPTNNTTILSNKEILLLEEDDHQVDDVVPNNTRLFYSQDHINNGGTSSFDGRLHSFLGSDKFEDHSLMSSRGTSPHHMLGKRIHDHAHAHAHAHAHTMEGEELDLELRLGHYSW